jgi:hypothetical protein
MSNTCGCPEPPGGSVTCADDQLAVCTYQSGHIVSGCYDRPRHVSQIADPVQSNLALANWILSMVMGVGRVDAESIDSGHVQLLRSGQYTNPTTGAITRFLLPKDINLESIGATKTPSATRTRSA